MKSEKVVSSFVWRFMERFGAYIVSFVVSVVLARLLEPEIFGTVALVTVFINILQVFVDTGLGRALIQKKDADELDFSSVFYFNMLMCIVLYSIIYLVAPCIARFYNNQELVNIIRVLSITLVISGLKNVQQAYVSRKMLFKKFFFATLAGTIVSALVGIFMAYQGGGVWALVGQSLTNTLIDTLMLWLTVKWRPKIKFSWIRLKTLLSYSWKLLVAALIGTISDNLRQLIIGKLYSSEDLAYYNKGDQIPNIVNGNVNAALESAIFPALSEAQDNVQNIKNMTRRVIVISTYMMAPLLVGLAACSETLVKLLLTEKWLPCVSYMRIFCITYLFYPLHTANLNAILAIGRSDIDLKLEIIKKVLEILILILVARHGVMAIGYSLILICVINMFINAYPNKKLIGYGFVEQIRDIFPELAIASIMGVVVYVIGQININDFILLLLQIATGAIVYIGLSAVSGLDAFVYLFGIIKRKKIK